jgi:hypothetical protein
MYTLINQVYTTCIQDFYEIFLYTKKKKSESFFRFSPKKSVNHSRFRFIYVLVHIKKRHHKVPAYIILIQLEICFVICLLGT